MGSPLGITGLLRAWGEGDDAALDRLTPLIYDELHRIARRYMRREHPGNTLQATALLNEAWLHLLDGSPVAWHDRAHFFAVASQTMRRILVDTARQRAAGKRGGRAVHFQLNESIDAAPRATAT